MWCPSCGAEYRPGFTRCTDCDVDLVDELPREIGEPRADVDAAHLGSEPVEVYSGSRLDAELIRSVLEGSGIRCALWGTGSSYIPETGAKHSRVRVMVRPEDMSRAQEVIDAAGVGDLDLDVQGEWEPPPAEVGELLPADWADDVRGAQPGEPDPGDWEEDDLEEPGAGPWYSRPWGQVVMAVIALLVVVAMIATYALE